MTLESSLKDLRGAVVKEQQALAAMDKLYCEFVVKMLQYQTGGGEAPTHEEFQIWRDCVDVRIEFSRQRGLL